MFRELTSCPNEEGAVQQVKLVPRQDGSSAMPMLHGCQQRVGTGVFAGSQLFVRYSVDDGVLVERCFCSDGRQC